MRPRPEPTPPSVAHSHVIKRDSVPPIQPSTLLSKNAYCSRSTPSLLVPFCSSVVIVPVRTHGTCHPVLRSPLGPLRCVCVQSLYVMGVRIAYYLSPSESCCRQPEQLQRSPPSIVPWATALLSVLVVGLETTDQAAVPGSSAITTPQIRGIRSLANCALTSPSHFPESSSSSWASAQLSPRPQTIIQKVWSRHSSSSRIGAMPKGSAMTSPSSSLRSHWTRACPCSVKPRVRAK